MSDQKISYYGSEGHLRLDQKNRGVEFLSHKMGHQDIKCRIYCDKKLFFDFLQCLMGIKNILVAQHFINAELLLD